MSNPTFVADELVTASKMNQLPKGWLGYAQVVANQASIATTAVDLTGLTVTVTLVAGRRIKVSAQILISSAGGVFELNIAESSTVFKQCNITASASGVTGTSEVLLSPTAGAHTYKLTGRISTGTATLLASAIFPSHISVEDLGTV